MENIRKLSNRIIFNTYKKGIKPLFKEEEYYLKDPIFHIQRNRVTAEIMQSLIQSNIGEEEEIDKLRKYLINNQKEDGCWHEIHPNYNRPSALITSFVGDALISLYKNKKSNELEKAIYKAKEYVLSHEKKPGYFLKSTNYTADHLNVDASCGAFLSNYGDCFQDNESINACKRVINHIISHQWKNGVYPYTVDKGNYRYIKNLPCIHYQAVTIYYLSKIHFITKSEKLEKSIRRGGDWLLKTQRPNGYFDWSNSGLLFSYYLIGSYAFAYASYFYLSKFDKNYLNNAKSIITILEKHLNGLFLRWETSNWLHFPRSIFDSISTAKINDGSINRQLFSFGYALYRQVSRRRYANYIDDSLFKLLISIFNIKVSTVDPFSNYPDLFMTSEIMNSLSSVNIEA